MQNTQTNEDLTAFERRLIEILACYQPQTTRWRMLLVLMVIATSVTAFQWLSDPETQQVPLAQSLHNHWFFTSNCIALVLLFISGIHKRVVAPTIIVARIRNVLKNFNMSCDRKGRLILKKKASSANNNSSQFDLN